jgi:hypothetical protein
MRRSHLVLTTGGIAVAVVTGSAFTAANTMTVGDQIAGYGQVNVTGAEVTDIEFTPDATDNTNMDAVVFTLADDISGQDSSVTVKNGGGVVGSYPCTETVAWDTTSMEVTCATPDIPFAGFDAVGFTVRD